MNDIEHFKNYFNKYFDKPRKDINFDRLNKIENVYSLEEKFEGMNVSYYNFLQKDNYQVDDYCVLFVYNHDTDFYIPLFYFYSFAEMGYTAYLSFKYRKNEKACIFNETENFEIPFILNPENSTDFISKMLFSLPKTYHNLLFSNQLISTGHVADPNYFLKLFISFKEDEVHFKSGIRGQHGFLEYFNMDTNYQKQLSEFSYSLIFFHQTMYHINVDLIELFSLESFKDFKNHSFSTVLNNFYKIDLYDERSFNYPLSIPLIFDENDVFKAVIDMSNY
jgi:hypothetical protein